MIISIGGQALRGIGWDETTTTSAGMAGGFIAAFLAKKFTSRITVVIKTW
jgi:hypothetical protein